MLARPLLRVGVEEDDVFADPELDAVVLRSGVNFTYLSGVVYPGTLQRHMDLTDSTRPVMLIWPRAEVEALADLQRFIERETALEHQRQRQHLPHTAPTHQRGIDRGPTVLTYYYALCGSDVRRERERLLGGEEDGQQGVRNREREPAATLQQAGVGRGDRVGVCMTSGSSALYVTILGVLSAGAALLPSLVRCSRSHVPTRVSSRA